MFVQPPDGGEGASLGWKSFNGKGNGLCRGSAVRWREWVWRVAGAPRKSMWLEPSKRARGRGVERRGEMGTGGGPCWSLRSKESREPRRVLSGRKREPAPSAGHAGNKLRGEH